MELLNDFFGMSKQGEVIFLSVMLGIACLVGIFAYYLNHASLPGEKKD